MDPNLTTIPVGVSNSTDSIRSLAKDTSQKPTDESRTSFLELPEWASKRRLATPTCNPSLEQNSSIDWPLAKNCSCFCLQNFFISFLQGYETGITQKICGWLGGYEKSNHLVLKGIIEALGRFVVNVQVFQRNDDKTIYLEFQKDNKEYVVIFPIDFPKTNLIIIDKTENKTIEGVNWEFSGDILDSSLTYIKSSLHIKDTFLSRILNIK